MKKKKDKPKYIDDGHTVYNMDNLEDKRLFSRKEKDDGEGLNRKERFTAIKAAFEVYLPRVLGVILCFTVATILVYLWLK